MSTETKKGPVIVVDAMNLFIKHYAANSAMSAHGEHAGGTIGFMIALKNLITRHRPSRVIVAWESGGSYKRRQLYPDYKMQRKPVSLNRYYEDIPDTHENKNKQIAQLISLLNHVPICQVYVPDCEADDVIAYIAKQILKDDDVIIVSSDSDFYQLLDDRIKIFRPTKKVFITNDDVIKDRHVSAVNFALAKAICGDAADNITGIPGVGFKTIGTRLPMFKLEHVLEIDDVVEACRTAQLTSNVKAYKMIVENVELVKRNIRLICLDGTMMTPDQMRKVSYTVDTFEPTRNKISLIRELVEYGLNTFDVDSFFYTMMTL